MKKLISALALAAIGLALLFLVAYATRDVHIALQVCSGGASEKPTTFCLNDTANAGITSTWITENVAAYWGIAVAADCEEPDVAIITASLGLTNCGWLQGGTMVLNTRCFEGDIVWSNNLPARDTAKAIMLHEFGHVFGLDDADAPSGMAVTSLYLPNDADRAALEEAKCYTP